MQKSHFLNNLSVLCITKNIIPWKRTICFFPLHTKTIHTHTHTHTPHKMFYSRALSKSYFKTFYFLWQPEMMFTCLEHGLLQAACHRRLGGKKAEDDSFTSQTPQRQSAWPNAIVQCRSKPRPPEASARVIHASTQ